jgi:hypothetical protein
MEKEREREKDRKRYGEVTDGESEEENNWEGGRESCAIVVKIRQNNTAEDPIIYKYDGTCPLLYHGDELTNIQVQE